MNDQPNLPAFDPTAIREIFRTDAKAVAALSAELGYPVAVPEMEQRIDELRSSPDRIGFVACRSGTVVGWVDASIVRRLAAGSYGEVAGLVVKDGFRDQGIGRELLREAERWVEGRGVSGMLVRSRTTREAAHRFYLREGYSVTKTSTVFWKQLFTE